MPDPEFLFALELSDETTFDRMLTDIAKAVSVHLGLAQAAVDALVVGLRDELSRAAAAGRRRGDVRFRTRAGELEIVVAYDDGAHWRSTRPLP